MEGGGREREREEAGKTEGGSHPPVSPFTTYQQGDLGQKLDG